MTEPTEIIDPQLTLFEQEHAAKPDRLKPEPDLQEIHRAIDEFGRSNVPETWFDGSTDFNDIQYMRGFLTGVRWMIYRARIRRIVPKSLMLKFGINYKLIYFRLKRHYPYIEATLNRPSKLKSFEDIGNLYSRYVAIQTNPGIELSKFDPKLRFIAVVVLMDDSEFFDDSVPVRKGLSTALSNVLGCDRTVISHSLRTVKDYKRIYPKFWEEVQYFYRQMTAENEKE